MQAVGVLIACCSDNSSSRHIASTRITVTDSRGFHIGTMAMPTMIAFYGDYKEYSRGRGRLLNAYLPTNISRD